MATTTRPCPTTPASLIEAGGRRRRRVHVRGAEVSGDVRARRWDKIKAGGLSANVDLCYGPRLGWPRQFGKSQTISIGAGGGPILDAAVTLPLTITVILAPSGIHSDPMVLRSGEPRRCAQPEPTSHTARLTRELSATGWPSARGRSASTQDGSPIIARKSRRGGKRWRKTSAPS